MASQIGPDGKPMPPGLLKTSRVKVNSVVTAMTQYLYNEHGQLVQTDGSVRPGHEVHL